jgi:hypothetical protein
VHLAKVFFNQILTRSIADELRKKKKLIENMAKSSYNSFFVANHHAVIESKWTWQPVILIKLYHWPLFVSILYVDINKGISLTFIVKNI